MFNSKVVLSVCLFTVAGCGSTTEPPTFDELSDAANAIAPTIEPDLEFGPTALGSLPAGSVEYQGFVGLGENVIEEEPETIGELTVNANFASSDVSAQIYNIADSFTGPINGEITGTGNIDGDGGVAGFLIPMAGVLSADGDTVVISGDIQGTFFGPTGGSVVVGGDVTLETVDGDFDIQMLGFAHAD